jgi:ankyrin repeat protein
MDMTTTEKLFDAAWNGDVAALRSLLESEASLPERALESALEAAAYNAKPDAAEFLLQQGANASAFSPISQETVLHQVITKTTEGAARTRIVKSLIAHGADVHQTTARGVETRCFARDIRTRGETPLHRAAAFGDAEMIAALLAAGADPAAKDVNGDSPLTWASWHLRENTILKLLLYGEFTGSLG